MIHHARRNIFWLACALTFNFITYYETYFVFQECWNPRQIFSSSREKSQPAATYRRINNLQYRPAPSSVKFYSRFYVTFRNFKINEKIRHAVRRWTGVRLWWKRFWAYLNTKQRAVFKPVLRYKVFSFFVHTDINYNLCKMST